MTAFIPSGRKQNTSRTTTHLLPSHSPLQLLLLTLCLLFSPSVQAQVSTLPIGGWRSHFSYHQVIDVAQSDYYVYLATPWALLVVDKSDGSKFKMDKINALSETGIQQVAYNREGKTLMIAYTNNKIDLFHDGQLSTLFDLQNFNAISGDKEVKEILMEGADKAYLATNFGISLLNLEKREFSFTTFTDQIVFDVAIYQGMIYAAMEDGLYRIAPDHPFIEDFGQWERLGQQNGLPADYSGMALAVFNDKLYLGTENKIFRFDGETAEQIYQSGNLDLVFLTEGPTRLMAGFDEPGSITGGKVLYFQPDDSFTPAPDCLHRPRAAEEDEQGNVWFADLWGSIYVHYAGEESCSTIEYNSPATHYVYAISLSANEVWVATGGVKSNWNVLLRETGLLQFKNGVWLEHNRYTRPDLAGSYDFLQVVQQPEKGLIYAASYYNGLYKYDGESFFLYDKDNSPLQTHPADTFHTRVAGLAFDESQNLWISNNYSPTPICVLKADGEWQCFNPSCGNQSVSHIAIDQNGYKWFALTDAGAGLLVFDQGDFDNPEDDRCRIISSGNSLLPDNNVNCIAVDLDGEVWVGTAKGPIAFACGNDPFDASICQGNKRIGELDDFGAYLLETENVLSIAVDGANRKWFGTENGAFLLSPDGKEQIAHLTTDNSLLPDNTVLDIAIDPKTGEIWFGTGAGIVVMRGEATEGGQVNELVANVFPNPVRPEYNGPIAISGLARDANFKITDLNGRLIYEGTALGGQAIWDGRDYNGRRASTGVYLVFSTSDLIFGKPDTLVARIVFVQ